MAPISAPAESRAIALARRVLRIEAEAVAALADRLGPDFERAVEIILKRHGRVIVTGIGKSGHIARKIAATLASTGTPAYFVHAAEAAHGDLGMITPEDVVIALSNSGSSEEVLTIVPLVKRQGARLIAMTGKADSPLAREADAHLEAAVAEEACPLNLAPTASTTAALALGDALAVALMHRKGFRREDFQVFHPGGKLGAQLVKVEGLMHKGEAVPLLSPDTPMREGLIAMTAKGFGLAGVVEGDRLVGVVTDGDLRRNIDVLMERTAGEIATRNPKTVAPGSLASEALSLMNEAQISALFVVDDRAHVMGLLHIHDCLRAGVA